MNFRTAFLIGFITAPLSFYVVGCLLLLINLLPWFRYSLEFSISVVPK